MPRPTAALTDEQLADLVAFLTRSSRLELPPGFPRDAGRSPATSTGR